MSGLAQAINDAQLYLKSKFDCNWHEATFVTLGSGFKAIADQFEVLQKVALADIPHQPSPTVAGHGSDLILCEVDNKPVLFATGRVHLYEGHCANDVVHLMRSVLSLGVSKAIVTNASGSLKREIPPGTIALLSDHINATGQNCLIGTPAEWGEKFVNMVGAYHPKFGEMLNQHSSLTEVVYCGLVGPNYETPAETAAFGRWGADVVGMSTVQEVLAARQMGCTVGGLTMVTNYAGGLATEVNHQEVLDAGRSQASKLVNVLQQAVQVMQII
jgi:purine-nucleoside phosphorylase